VNGSLHVHAVCYRHHLLYGKSPSCFSARVPEVTSMQVFECIGGMENPHSRYPCLRFVTSGSSWAMIGHLSSGGKGSRIG
jgi:hypothetical protein